MSLFVVSVCTVLMVYWCARTRVLLYGDEADIREAIETDLQRGFRIARAVRSLF